MTYPKLQLQLYFVYCLDFEQISIIFSSLISQEPQTYCNSDMTNDEIIIHD